MFLRRIPFSLSAIIFGFSLANFDKIIAAFVDKSKSNSSGGFSKIIFFKSFVDLILKIVLFLNIFFFISSKYILNKFILLNYID